MTTTTPIQTNSSQGRPMLLRTIAAATSLATLATLTAGVSLAQRSANVASASDAHSWQVHAGKLYTGAGDPLENALVVVANGKIQAITPGVEAPRDCLHAAVLTAGMVDASARIQTGLTSVEQSREVTPTVESKYGIDPFDARWARLAKSGVTTAFVAPLNRNVVGGVGAIVKTAGPTSIEDRMLSGESVLCGAIGSLPSSGNSPAFGRVRSFYNRRPTTRMGVEWEWRKAFFDAGQALPDTTDPDLVMLRRVLAGEVPLMIEAYPTQDIRTAVFLKEEMMREGFGTMRLIIDAGAEAWREPQMLVRTETPVILPPMPSQGRTNESALMPVETAKRLQDAGIRFALSAHDGRDAAERLDIQAGFAMRGGLTRAEALLAVTKTPAEILGVADRVGTVEVGKDADLVLWNGEPFEATTRAVGVLVGGHLALDPR